MKLSLSQLEARCPAYRDIKALNLDCLGLHDAENLDKCLRLEYASLRFNALQDLGPFARLKGLWVLDLQQNNVVSLEPLGALVVLGALVLTSNPLTLESLQTLKGLHLLSLEVSGLPTYRVAESLPRTFYLGLWTLNGEYLSSRPFLPVKHTTFSPRAQEVLDIANESNLDLRERRKFEYLAKDLDLCSELQGQMTFGGTDLSKGRGQRFPQFQLQTWQGQSLEIRRNLAVFCNLYLEGLCGEQVFKMVVAAVSRDIAPRLLSELKPHQLLGLALLLGSSQGLTLLDLARDFHMTQARLQNRGKMVNRESAPDHTPGRGDRIRELCREGLDIAERCKLTFREEPRLKQTVPLRALFSTMRLFAELPFSKDNGSLSGGASVRSMGPIRMLASTQPSLPVSSRLPPIESGTFLTSLAPMPRSLSGSELHPVKRRYDYFEAHKDLLPPLPQRKVCRPKLSVLGRPAGVAERETCSNHVEHLTRVYNRDFTPWVPYLLYPQFPTRRDQFCVNYGQILVCATQRLHPETTQSTDDLGPRLDVGPVQTV